MGRPFIEDVKMVLLAGKAAGKSFGPATYQDRLDWIHKGSPPNIVALIAHIEETKRNNQPTEPKMQTPPTIQRAQITLTDEQKQRIEANRQSALRRKLNQEKDE